MRKAITFLLPLLAGACAAGPDYHPPATPAASGEAFVTTTSATDPTLPLPDAWWRLYDDPALDRLITRAFAANTDLRSEEHTSELQSLMRISYAVFCLKKTKYQKKDTTQS